MFLYTSWGEGQFQTYQVRNCLSSLPENENHIESRSCASYTLDQLSRTERNDATITQTNEGSEVGGLLMLKASQIWQNWAQQARNLTKKHCGVTGTWFTALMTTEVQSTMYVTYSVSTSISRIQMWTVLPPEHWVLYKTYLRWTAALHAHASWHRNTPELTDRLGHRINWGILFVFFWCIKCYGERKGCNIFKDLHYLRWKNQKY